jgi:hypothetical protein
LLAAGDADFAGPDAWIDYLGRYGFGSADIPELIRMACDQALHLGDGMSDEVWAPIHACRALAQLGAVEAAEPLLAFMTAVEDTEMPYEGLEHVLAMMGPAVMGPVLAYLQDPSTPAGPFGVASDVLTKVAANHPEQRAGCVAALTSLLDQDLVMDPGSLAWAVRTLVDLKAPESIDTIRAVFRRRDVDESICSDIEDVEIDLDLRRRRPRPVTGDVRSSPKIGRNEPCPCGSGRKYKKCCLDA